MNFELNTTSLRIAFAIGISVLLHGLLLWGSSIEISRFESSLPPLVVNLETLPSAPLKSAQRTSPVAKSPVNLKSLPAKATPFAISEVVAASAPPAVETLAQPESVRVNDRPRLPDHAQLIFSVYQGTGDFKIGEMMHTLAINNGHYVLESVTETVGLAKLFKSYKITQYSSGSYSENGMRPEQFFEERADRLGTQRNTVEFDHTAQRANFSHGGVAALPPDTQDILSILYQFPPLANTETVTASVSNGKKIERYEFEIAANTRLLTTMGELHTVHLRKLHQPGEEGLEVWLAREYRLLPVKMRIIDRDGEVSGEIVITDLRAQFEEEIKQDVDH